MSDKSLKVCVCGRRIRDFREMISANKKNNNILPPPSPKKFLKKSFGWILNIKPNEHMEGTY